MFQATVLLYSPEIKPFLEDLTNLADRVFYFERMPKRITKTDSRNVTENEGSEDA